MATAMTLELKGIKHYPTMSEETNCYEAVLYVDGKPFAHVSNTGKGGCDSIHAHKSFKGTHADLLAKRNEISDWLKANVPPIPSTFGGNPLTVDLELWCALEVDTFIILKDMRRALKTKILARLADGKVYQWKKPATDVHQLQLVAQIKEKKPGSIVLNELPEAEALAVYRKAAEGAGE